MPSLKCIEALNKAAGRRLSQAEVDGIYQRLDKAREQVIAKGVTGDQIIPATVAKAKQDFLTEAESLRPDQVTAEEFDAVTQIDPVNDVIEDIVTNPVFVEAAEQAERGESTHTINTEERRQLRAQLSMELYGEGAQKKQRKAVILLGPPASGKSTLAANVIDEYGALEVDSDLAKERLPEFNDGIGANVVHLESKLINHDVLQQAMEAGDNVVLPIVGHTEKTVMKQVEELKKNGYTVEARLVVLPVEQTFRRAVSRWIQTGRFIPADYIFEKVSNNPVGVFSSLTEKGVFDGQPQAFSSDVAQGETFQQISVEEAGELSRVESVRLRRYVQAYRHARSQAAGQGPQEYFQSVATPEDAAQVLFEVAPDPNNTELTNQWNSLNPGQQHQVSLSVAEKIIPEILEAVNAQGNVAVQFGGYEGATNTSFSLSMDSQTDASAVAEATRLAGFALSQDSMMTVSSLPFEGAEEVGIVTINLPEGEQSQEAVTQLYNRLWELEEGGEKLVGGHTTVGNQMAILNYSVLSDEALADRIDEHLGGQYNLDINTGYAWFPGKEEYNYASDRQAGPTPAGESPIRQAANRLRGEASNRLQEAISQAKTQTLEQDKRGSILFGEDITKVDSLIKLFEGADLSTFLHESGHFFFEVMLDIASKPDAPQVIVDDIQTLMDFIGVESLEKWNAMTPEERRAGHEKVAESFETYLFEGKSPSLELRDLFRTVKNWFIQVYRNIQDMVSLTPEVREVFDRMLATEQQISAKESMSGLKPLFTTAEAAGIPLAEWQQYQEDHIISHEEATEKLQSAGLRDMQWLANAKSKVLKQLQNDAKDKRKEVSQQVRDETLSEPVYKAMHFLKKGEMPDGSIPEGIQPEKMNESELAAMYAGRDVDWKRLRRGRGGMIAKEGGVHPEAIAAMFGFDSADQMIQEMLAARPVTEVIQERTDERMTQLYGELTDPAAMEQAANEAIHNQARVRMVRTEMNALNRQVGKRQVLAREAKEYAKETIGGLRVRDIRPNKYLTYAAQAARRAEQALKKGDIEAAATDKRAQLLNMELFREATKAAKEIDKIQQYHNKFSKKSVMEKVGSPYIERIEALQSAYNFRKSVSLKAIDAAKTFRAWVDEMIADDKPIMIPDEIINTAMNDSKSYKDVSLNELRGLTDAVKNLEAIGRSENEIRIGERKMAINNIVDALGEQMRELPPVNRQNRQNPTEFEKLREKMNFTLARLTKVGFVTKWIDGKDQIGLAHESIMQKANDAQAKYYDLYEKQGKQVLEMFRDMPKEQMKRWQQDFYIPEVNRTMKIPDMLMVFMNLGTESNMDKLMRGNQWDMSQLNAVMRNLTKEDYDFGQKILDVVNGFKDELFDTAERATGLRPKAIEPTPIETPFGTYPGGYFPVKYDKRRSRKGAIHEAAAEDLINSGNDFLRANIYEGMTKGRTQFADEIRLDMATVQDVIQESIMFISHYEAVRDIDTVTKHPAFEQQMKETFGEGHWKEMRQWVKDLATRGRDTAPKDLVTWVLRHVRMGTTIVAMGFKISTGLVQILGLSSTMKETGAGPMMHAWGRIMGHGLKGMMEARDTAFEHSQILKHRLKSFDREILNAMKTMEGNRGWRARTGEASLMHIGYVQLYTVDLPSWWAGYEKGMKDFDGDHARSVKYADWVVENMQGSGEIKDMAGWVRDRNEYLRMLTMFYTYFSSMFANERDIVRKVKQSQYGEAVGGIFFLITLPIIMEEFMRGNLPECDDLDEECLAAYGSWFAAQHATYPVQGIPVARDFMNALVNERDYQMSPVQSTLTNLQYIMQNSDKLFTGDASDYQTRTTINTLGVLTKLPVGQFTKSGQYLKDLHEGEADADDPLEFAQEMIYGEKKR